MGLKGKFVRREGTGVIFGSQKRPEWKPIDLSGQIDPAGLIPGEYYDLELSENRLVGYTKLAARTGGGGGGGSYSAPSRPSASSNPQEIPMASLMASATGFAKSAMEAGICKTWVDAAQAGMAWAERWGEPPPPKLKHKEAPPPPPDEYPDDPIPF